MGLYYDDEQFNPYSKSNVERRAREEAQQARSVSGGVAGGGGLLLILLFLGWLMPGTIGFMLKEIFKSCILPLLILYALVKIEYWWPRSWWPRESYYERKSKVW
jgi:hypothetical protein